MAAETVLLYNCGGSEWTKLRQIFMMLRIRIQIVEPDQYGLTLDDLLAHSEQTSHVDEVFTDPMMVFCHLEGGKLDQLLTTMRRAGLPRIALKAMLTSTNHSWTSQQLWTELRREHEAMTSQQTRSPHAQS